MAGKGKENIFEDIEIDTQFTHDDEKSPTVEIPKENESEAE